MTAIQCPSCGYRHLEAVATCMNCGAPLIPLHKQLSAPGNGNRARSTPGREDNEVAEYERFIASPGQRKLDGQPKDTPEHHLIKHAPVPPKARQTWKKSKELQPYNPYETMIDVVPPMGFSSRSVAIREEQEQVVDLELWKKDKLPWNFPTSRPIVSGTVVHIESKEEIIDYPDIIAAIVTLLTEIIWIMANVQQIKENDRIVMTTVRIQTYDNQRRDVRLRGNMRGADLSLGDQVSLWGTMRNGVLFVKRGFNHTTRGIISTHSISLLAPAAIVVVILIACIYLAPAWIPLIGHWLELFFPFLHQNVPHTK